MTPLVLSHIAERARLDPAKYASRAAYRSARADAWVGLMRDGVTMTAIGLAAGISRERVRQIVRRAGYTEQRARPPADPRRVKAALRDRDCRNLKGLARLAGCREAEARVALRQLGLEADAKRLWERRARSWAPGAEGYGRAVIIRGLQEFHARHGRAPGITDALAGLLPFSKTTVLRRFGRWTQAIEAAGLESKYVKRGRKTAPRRRSP